VANAEKPDEPGHLGHRRRLRERFLAGGGAALADYELLEIVLFQAIPRQDTKPIAKALLARFGTYAGVLTADPADLAGVKGVGQSAVVALKSVAEAAVRLAREEVIDRPVLSSWTKLIAYLRTNMAHDRTEALHVLFLDTKNKLIADERQQTGTVNHTPMYPREVFKRALELGSTAIILVHNHPSGDPTPSKSDIQMTHEIRDIGESLGIRLHDHVIVAKGGHSSFKEMGLL
jgi:DNA repair protein RadC